MKPSPATEDVERAERAVIRAAMGVVTEEGWAFQQQSGDVPIVLLPDAMRRLESAIANLYELRKALAKKRRKK